jgi:NADH:ubiquinone oxidoreductase subunit B-like Fe-S oxidoreductase
MAEQTERKTVINTDRPPVIIYTRKTSIIDIAFGAFLGCCAFAMFVWGFAKLMTMLTD